MQRFPQETFNLSRIIDPKGSIVETDGDNPDGIPDGCTGSNASGHAEACCCGCCQRASAGPGGSSPLTPGSESPPVPFPYASLRGTTGFLIVRLADAYVPKLSYPESEKSLKQLAEGAFKLDGLLQALTVPQQKVVPSRPLVTNRLLCVGPNSALPSTLYEALRFLETKAASSPFPIRHSLLSYWRVDLRACSHLMDTVFDRLAALAEVDLVYRELPATDPMMSTPSFLYGTEQSYLDAAPVGIGARWAKSRLPPGRGEPVRLLDLEQQWVTEHNDLGMIGLPFFGKNRYVEGASSGEDGHHGTAVLALLASGLTESSDEVNADDEGIAGVEGIADAAVHLAITSHYVEGSVEGSVEEDLPVLASNGHVAEAIADALAGYFGVREPLARGDILLLEVQRAYLPTEADHADFDAIRLATASGVLVVEAAGNGGLDLDAYVDETGRRSFARRGLGFMDSGAVLVGAAESALPHNRALFSNYGSRVECYGWGTNVTTAGYGDYVAGEGGQPKSMYTNTFRGTSSAAPCVAGAAALLQYLFRHSAVQQSAVQQSESVLDPINLTPWRLRQLLADPTTSTPQGPDVPGAIGVMPDLQAILRHSALKLLPDLFLRRSLDIECRDVTCMSPDVFLCEDADKVDVDSLDVPTYLNSESHPMHVRVRNLGGRDGNTANVAVSFYVGPAATLLTPERWAFAGSKVDSVGKIIPRGGRAVALSSLVVSTPAGTRSSLMAILTYRDSVEPLVEPLLDPLAGKSFDWEAFLDLLDDGEVGCRNVHGVSLGSSDKSEVEFSITGAMDRERTFDLEVVQHLPQGVQVSLDLPAVLAASLRQRQSWGGEMSLAETTPGRRLLALPAIPRLLFRDVVVRQGASHDAYLVFENPEMLNWAGHSVAIRQLWQGREVGRITWKTV